MTKTFDQGLVERGENIAQQFANGWIMGEVVNYEDAPTPYDQYDALPAGSSNATGPGGAGVGAGTYWWQWFTAPNQRQDMFRERDKDKIIQAFIGIYPPRLRLFRQFPAPEIRGNLYEIKVAAIPVVTSGGYINGEWSPYQQPTSLTELIVPPELIAKFALFNPEAVAVFPRFQVFIRRIQMRYFKKNNSTDQKTIDDIIDKKIPCKKWSPGLVPSDYDVSDRTGADIIDWTPAVLKGVN